MSDAGSLVPVQPVSPLVTAEEAARRWQLFEDLKKKILIPWGEANTDYQRIRVQEKQPDGRFKTVEKDFIKRSGFRKLAVFFGLSDRIVREERIDRADGSFMWRIIVEIQATNGRLCTGVGICDSRERKFAHSEHDVYAIAQTRAKNRGISDMIAGGIISAEEAEEAPEESEKKGVKPEARAPSSAKPRIPTTLEEVEYRLGEHILELDKTLSLSVTAEGFRVDPKRSLDDEVRRMVTDIVRDMGGQYVSAGNSHWLIPRGE
jgi:hypothetical protein